MKRNIGVFVSLVCAQHVWGHQHDEAPEKPALVITKERLKALMEELKDPKPTPVPHSPLTSCSGDKNPCDKPKVQLHLESVSEEKEESEPPASPSGDHEEGENDITFSTEHKERPTAPSSLLGEQSTVEKAEGKKPSPKKIAQEDQKNK